MFIFIDIVAKQDNLHFLHGTLFVLAILCFHQHTGFGHILLASTVRFAPVLKRPVETA